MINSSRNFWLILTERRPQPNWTDATPHTHSDNPVQFGTTQLSKSFLHSHRTISTARQVCTIFLSVFTVRVWGPLWISFLYFRISLLSLDLLNLNILSSPGFLFSLISIFRFMWYISFVNYFISKCKWGIMICKLFPEIVTNNVATILKN